MNEALDLVLPVLLYTFGIILLIVLIILVIKLIMTLDKVDRIVDDVEDKVHSLDGLFSVIDKTTDSIALFSDSIVNTLASLFYKLFGTKSKRKRKNKKEEEDFDE